MPSRQCLVGRTQVQSIIWLVLLTLALLPASSQAAIAWTTQTQYTPMPSVPDFHLNTTLSDDPYLHLYPLTRAPQRTLKGNVTGTLVSVNLDNANKVTRSDIAFVSCDSSAYSVPSDVDGLVETAISSGPPLALLFYTTADSTRCVYQPSRSSQELYATFTLADPTAAREIRDNLKNSPASTNTTIIIEALMSPGRDVGSPQNTAMIILYTVTGIITVLFLGVIVTGTVRAHLNPDRYGPRQDPNGQRQSRARGIARAVVETLPIIKFGDQEDKQSPPKSDLEMASTVGEDRDSSTEETRTTGNERQAEGTNPSPTTTPAATATTTTVAATATATTAVAATAASKDAEDNTDAIQKEERQAPVVAENAPGSSGTSSGQSSGTGETAAANQETSETGTLVCPICTDEFVKGQDVRLLPCKHKFHPECVDPWLVNVSGTCPLCRIDLNPKEPGDEDAQSLWPALTQQSTGQHSIRQTVMEERLREVRGLQIPEDAEAEAEAEAEDTRRRNRLSQRIVDRLRVRTARHGEEYFP